jgi:acyl-CoA thioester hydrolase
MAPLIETYRGAVYPWHCDHVGHMNVMHYVGKFDEATWHLFNVVGLSGRWLAQNGRGMAAVEQRIAYRRELLAGDVVTVRSGVLEVRDKALRFVHEMTNAVTGEIAAITQLVAVHLDGAARKATGLPDDVKERARAAMVEYALPW